MTPITQEDLDKLDYVNGCYPRTEEEWQAIYDSISHNAEPIFILEIATNDGVKPNPCEIIKVDFKNKKVTDRFTML